MTARRFRLGLGVALVAIIALAGLLAPWIAPFDPNASGADVLSGATATHWMGTDDLGRDVWSRVLHGARISLLVGPLAALVAAIIGVPFGLLAGYARGRLNQFLVQVMDLFIALPNLVLALIITVMVGATLLNIVLVLGVVMWPEMARLVRGQVMSLRETPFIEAARAIGCKPHRVLFRHIWPNIMRIVAAQMAIAVSAAIFTAASLGFLGLGLPPPAADWGSMVQSGFDYLSLNPLLSLAPGAAVALTVLGFYLVGRSVE
ncbi:ABC transporter permease [Falsiroseomonas ponticola]|uniref:ABC transporter permease n=1 Tax=Falsiroseomonas ponticola TaxID=2786951 RepID=UPI0019328058|nr:ABC transporter permease [Roseomonas ponticola]